MFVSCHALELRSFFLLRLVFYLLATSSRPFSLKLSCYLFVQSAFVSIYASSFRNNNNEKITKSASNKLISVQKYYISTLFRL